MHDNVPYSGPIATLQSSGAALDTLDPKQVMQLLRSRGAVLFRGFAADPVAFKAFTERFCGRFLKHPLRKLRPKQTADGTIAEVLIGNDSVSLHGEMKYNPFPPDILWFHCVQPAVSGGQTVIADGRQILAALSADTRRQFETKRIRYYTLLDPSIWRALIPVKHRRAAVLIVNLIPKCSARSAGQEDILMEFVTDAIRKSGPDKLPGFVNSIENALEYGVDVSYADGERIPPAVLDDIRRAGLACAHDIEWQANDVVMIDNSRIMHGRRGFEGNERKINVRFGMLALRYKRYLS